MWGGVGVYIQYIELCCFCMCYIDLRIDAHILFLHVHIYRALLHVYRALLHIYRSLWQQGSFAFIFAHRSAIVSIYARSILYIGPYMHI